MSLSFILRLLYAFILGRIPGLRLFLPIDTVLAIVESVNAGIEYKLRVDVRFTDWPGIANVFREMSESLLNPTPEQQIEVVYALLAFATNIEDHLSMAEFTERLTPQPTQPTGQTGGPLSASDAASRFSSVGAGGAGHAAPPIPPFFFQGHKP
jgi:hypothetical protein